MPINILLNKLRRHLPWLLPTQKDARANYVIRKHFSKKNIPYKIVPNIEPTDEDIEISERLLGSYKYCVEIEKQTIERKKDGHWLEVEKTQSKFLQILDNNNPLELAEYLCNMSRQDATNGTVQGDLEYERITKDPEYRDFIALMTKDRLVSFAEAIGVLPCENPEQGPWGESIYVDIDLLEQEIEVALGIDITPPFIDGGLLKIVSKKSLFNERDINAMYTAWTLTNILQKKREARICEIGAGSGRLAYWANRFGFETYTIFDLPRINVIQGYYLLKSLGKDKIVLFGENSDFSSSNKVVILPYFHIDKISEKKFDLVVNQDSFPEIDEDSVLNYLKWIKKTSKRFFYSINHESKPPSMGGGKQLNVANLISEVGGYRRESRALYWLRKGYVAEVYSLN